MDVESDHEESDADDESNEDLKDKDYKDLKDHEDHEDNEDDDHKDDEDDKDENEGVPSAPHTEMIAYGNGGVRHHKHAIQPSNERTIQPSNQPAEVLCDSSPGISIYTCLSCPSPERVSIYDNWPLEECYTVREADIPQETRVMLLVKRLNILKDSSRSEETK